MVDDVVWAGDAFCLGNMGVCKYIQREVNMVIPVVDGICFSKVGG